MPLDWNASSVDLPTCSEHEEAEALLRGGPPFDPEELGLHRHGAYLTATEVVYLPFL